MTNQSSWTLANIGFHLTSRYVATSRPSFRPPNVCATFPLCAPYVAEPFLPTSLADDIARGGIRLRAAFPKLSRRVASVMREESRIIVRVACDGRHHGSFFEILAATGRHVSFEVTHVLALRGADLVEDHVKIDFREVARQLARSVECIDRGQVSTECGDAQSTRLGALVRCATSR
jgi:hypothetical protein